MKKFPTKLWIITLFIIAATFRVFFLDLVEFKADEAETVLQLIQFYHQPFVFTDSGYSHTNMHNPPLYYYILTALALPSRDPVYLSFIIALINTTLIPVLYLILRRYYTNLTAFIASLTYSLSPWSILYSRKIWNPDLIPIFVIPYLFFLHEIVIRKEIKYSFWLLLILTLFIQVHISGLSLLLVTLIAFLVLRIKFDYKKALVGFLVGLTPLIPYVLMNLNSSPVCPDCQAFLNFQNSPRSFDLQNFIRPLQILSGLYFENALGTDFPIFLEKYPLLKSLNLIFISQAVFLLLGLIYILKKRKNSVFLALILIFTPLLYFLTRTESYMYYFYILSPILALVIGIYSQFLFEKFRAGKRLLLIIFLVLNLGGNVLFEVYFNNFLKQEQIGRGYYGPIFAVTEEFVNEQTKSYTFLPRYELIKASAHLFANYSNFHQNLGEFFIEQNMPEQAELEFSKARTQD